MDKNTCLKIIANCDRALKEQRENETSFTGNYPQIIMAVPEYQYRDMAETIIRLLEAQCQQ